MHAFSFVVCRHPMSKRWLAVEENKDSGWWFPGGLVENKKEDHCIAAIRETREEAGIEVQLLGVLRVENSMYQCGGRQRVIFYAEPADYDQTPKQLPDKESLRAAWLSTDQVEARTTGWA